MTVGANLGTTVDRKWVVAVYLVTGFIVLPALVIIFVGVL